jgi:hypothetical protein
MADFLARVYEREKSANTIILADWQLTPYA